MADRISPRAIIRDFLWRRDYGKCGICHLPIEDRASIDIDHIVPVSKGGAEEMENLQLTHPRCNRVKATKPMAWMAMKDVQLMTGPEVEVELRRHLRGDARLGWVVVMSRSSDAEAQEIVRETVVELRREAESDPHFGQILRLLDIDLLFAESTG